MKHTIQIILEAEAVRRFRWTVEVEAASLDEAQRRAREIAETAYYGGELEHAVDAVFNIRWADVACEDSGADVSIQTVAEERAWPHFSASSAGELAAREWMQKPISSHPHWLYIQGQLRDIVAGAARAESATKSSQQLLSDLLWLEDRIQQLRYDIMNVTEETIKEAQED